MKKIVFIFAMVFAGMLSAKDVSQQEVKKEKTEEQGTCNWCTRSGGEMHCASAETCDEAKAIAKAMAEASQNIN